MIKFSLKLLAALPLPVIHTLAGAVGRYLAAGNSTMKRVSVVNIERCFPELDDGQRQQLVKESLIETAKTALESGRVWLGPLEKVNSLIREVHGEEHIQAALARGKGLILASPHLGNWELIAAYCGPRYPMTNLYRPPRQAALDPIIYNGRLRFKQTLAATDARGIRALYQALSRNEIVGILPDQDPRDSGGVFAPFFGHPANTMTLLSRLAQKSGAPVICCFARRLPGSRGFVLEFIPGPAEINNPGLAVSVAAVNCMVEAAVRQVPEQYQWSYKRFLTRPAGEGKWYRKR